MQPIIRRALAFAALLAVLPSLPLAAAEYDQRFTAARDAVYNQSLDPIRVSSLILSSRRTIEGIDNRRQRLYWLARLEALAGYMELHTTENMEAAERRYENSRTLALQALELGEFSEGHRLLSEAISNLCLIKGTGYALTNGLAVVRHARKALELDPHNSKAVIILAEAKIYPPKIFGGDPREGVELMKEALKVPELDKEDRFNIYSGIGVAYGKLEDYANARLYLRRALTLFPRNIYVNRELANLKQS
jgi:tetratricopeptide (TPR) repeat protein